MILMIFLGILYLYFTYITIVTIAHVFVETYKKGLDVPKKDRWGDIVKDYHGRIVYKNRSNSLYRLRKKLSMRFNTYGDLLTFFPKVGLFILGISLAFIILFIANTFASCSKNSYGVWDDLKYLITDKNADTDKDFTTLNKALQVIKDDFWDRPLPVIVSNKDKRARLEYKLNKLKEQDAELLEDL